MTPHDLIDRLTALARLDAPTSTQIAGATRFDFSRCEEDVTRGGVRIFRDLLFVDGRRVELLYLPMEREWTLVFRGDGGDVIDPRSRWGDEQAIKPSPTNKGYAIVCRAPLPTILTASTPENRLATISVRRE